MRAPNWTAGISVGLLIVAMVAVVRLSQNGPLRQDPRKAIEYYASQAAKKIYHAEDTKADEPKAEFGDYTPQYVASGSSQLVGEPEHQNRPICPICGGDSRFCAHSGAGAALVMKRPAVAGLTPMPIATIFDRNMDYYFGDR
ncbi:hypothetical protein [Fimbriimonas ginsengisoli]|uniref:Uncharacterized protein n=1 Tax=Fimbriimonas ginsengisoli Gsoil 348 TaxID=661478 RepID=A0A068NXW0_FIMGI|nr:hypothetical protein [Fimbriimonas ginsengisoli]AIE87620.1 hypothetical protein OP10G_4252 [Fimbriimonas ginsengisoli Gsoil 348]